MYDGIYSFFSYILSYFYKVPVELYSEQDQVVLEPFNKSSRTTDLLVGSEKVSLLEDIPDSNKSLDNVSCGELEYSGSLNPILESSNEVKPVNESPLEIFEGIDRCIEDSKNDLVIESGEADFEVNKEASTFDFDSIFKKEVSFLSLEYLEDRVQALEFHVLFLLKNFSVEAQVFHTHLVEVSHDFGGYSNRVDKPIFNFVSELAKVRQILINSFFIEDTETGEIILDPIKNKLETSKMIFNIISDYLDSFRVQHQFFQTFEDKNPSTFMAKKSCYIQCFGYLKSAQDTNSVLLKYLKNE